MSYFQGDFGGPLMQNISIKSNYYELIGIASFNYKCEEFNHPDGFTKVTCK